MTPDQITVIVMVSGFGLATAWAAWVSKTIVAILTILSSIQGTAQRVDHLETRADNTEKRVDDHDTLIRDLLAVPQSSD